jgi:dTDP-4-dehydrorhamnose reductase
MRVAVTGSAGRLGRALVTALEDAPFTGPFGPIAWSRRELDLDRPEAIDELLVRDRPEVVVHAAAWTDVDGCARDPALALRRNGVATGRIARACARSATDLVVISTNEVFDGERRDGRGYSAADAARPVNPYGASKLAGESAAREAYGMPVEGREPTAAGSPAVGGTRETGTGPALGIVRTAWLFGPPGHDFPAKILAAAGRAETAGQPLRVVADEFGNPTYAADLADAIAELIGSGDVSGLHHVVNSGTASRAEWARELLRQAGLQVPIVETTRGEWQRPSTPPGWGVLEPTDLPSGEPMRPWQEALADYLPTLLRSLGGDRRPTGAR